MIWIILSARSMTMSICAPGRFFLSSRWHDQVETSVAMPEMSNAFFYLFMVLHTYKLKCQTLPRFNSGIVKIMAPPFVIKFVIVGDELSCRNLTFLAVCFVFQVTFRHNSILGLSALTYTPLFFSLFSCFCVGLTSCGKVSGKECGGKKNGV